MEVELSDHFWKFRCRKSARRCGAKHVSKSKCTKHHMFGSLFDVQRSKKCMPLWCQKLRGSGHFLTFRCRPPQQQQQQQQQQQEQQQLLLLQLQLQQQQQQQQQLLLLLLLHYYYTTTTTTTTTATTTTTTTTTTTYPCQFPL